MIDIDDLDHVLRLDHVGIAVADLDEACSLYDKLGIPAEKEYEHVASQRVRVAFVPIGDTDLELLQATDDDSAIGRFIEKRGGGLHHLAFEVDDIDAALEQAVARGFRLIDQKARTGARGRLVAFLHPGDTQRVLVEFVQTP